MNSPWEAHERNAAVRRSSQPAEPPLLQRDSQCGSLPAGRFVVGMLAATSLPRSLYCR
jgi:hypothetical protein